MGGALGPDWHDGLQLTSSEAPLRQRRVVLETLVEVVALHSPNEMKTKNLFARIAGSDESLRKGNEESQCVLFFL